MAGSPDHDFDESTISQMSTALKAAQILEKSRAEGIPMNELALVNQGGKSKCVTQKEKEHIDKTRRQDIIKKLRQRNTRGDNSLTKDIAARIQSCQEMLEYISFSGSMSAKDMLVIRRNLESTNNRAASLIKEVTVLETAIERKKEADEVISDFEKASADLMTAIKERQFAQITELRAYCEEKMPIYNLRQKRLKPYLNQCRQMRIKFIAEKRTIMQMQYQVYSQVVEIIAQDQLSGKFAGFKEEALRSSTKAIEQVRHYRTQGKAQINSLSKPLGKVSLSFISDIEDELNKIDESFLSVMAQEMADLISLLRDARITANEESIDVGEGAETRRMAYQEKADKQ